KDLKLDDFDFGILHSQDVDGSVFVERTYDQLVNHPFGITGEKATKLAKVIKEINSQSSSREPTGLVHIFIDNSNAEIEGKKMVSTFKNVFEDQLCIDYGRLLRIWKEIEYLGFRVEVYDGSVIDHKEKDVDSELGFPPGKIVLVAGDGDYGPMLRRALLRNWTVEIWFWTKGNEISRLWIIKFAVLKVTYPLGMSYRYKCTSSP
ncbi:4499_t:CDS:2, partial [Funneliformis mosseae]